jgi:hypothetical protein
MTTDQNATMTRKHTFKSIADERSVDKRTVQRWFAKAKTENGEFGEMRGNSRYFSDYEKSFILSYEGVKVTAKTVETVATKVFTPVEIIETPVETSPEPLAVIPQQFNLQNLRGGLATAPTIDPTSVGQALQVMDQLVQAMDHDIQSQARQLQQSQELARQLKDKAQQLQQGQILYQMRSEVNQLLQTQSQQETQALLGKLQELSGGSG